MGEGESRRRCYQEGNGEHGGYFNWGGTREGYTGKEERDKCLGSMKNQREMLLVQKSTEKFTRMCTSV